MLQNYTRQLHNIHNLYVAFSFTIVGLNNIKTI